MFCTCGFNGIRLTPQVSAPLASFPGLRPRASLPMVSTVALVRGLIAQGNLAICGTSHPELVEISAPTKPRQWRSGKLDASPFPSWQPRQIRG